MNKKDKKGFTMDKKELHGNIVVGQSGGPTAAINATLAVLRELPQEPSERFWE